MSRVKHPAPSNPTAQSQPHGGLDSASPLTPNTVGRAHATRGNDIND